MNYTPVITGILVLSFLLIAGCTQSGGSQTTVPTSEVPTPILTATVAETAAAVTSGGSTVPGPIQTLPANLAVSVTVDKAGTYSTTIITSFDGGKGMAFVSRLDVVVTRPDGSVVTGTLKPVTGDVLELEGTNGTDRVEVTAYMKSGDVYKIIDQQMPYKTRG